MKRYFTFILASIAFFISLNAQDKPVHRISGTTGTVAWGDTAIYLLDGFVFVDEGETLTIKPGVIVKGAPGQEENASALIVAKGGTIIAEGTEQKPIIFTAQADTITQPLSQSNIPTTVRGLWGGVILLGDAPTNQTGETQVEGIPTSETRGLYGAETASEDPAHDAGSMKYVSIRHGGTDIGEGNEINGLTLGACGTETTISYVEVIANKDDGVEWFGGMPRTDHVLVSFCGDDSYDYDQGYSGYNQFLAAIQDPNAADRLGEHDGGDDNETGRPYAHPLFSNVTYIGIGADQNNRLITFRDNAGGEYHNSIFTEQGRGIDIEDLATDVDSWSRFQDDSLIFANNVFWNVGDNADTNAILTVSAYDTDGNDVDPDAAQLTALREHFKNNGNVISNPQITSDNPVPPSAVGATDFTSLPDWFSEVSYTGAFQQNWAATWSLTFAQRTTVPENQEYIYDTGTGVGEDNEENETVYWSNDSVRVLNGFVFVNSGDTLEIEAGTIIKGFPGQEENASALIVAKGGYIRAMGTANEPIIFTGLNDDLQGSVPDKARGLWGGVILLGDGPTNQTGETQIEGIPTSETRGLYGATTTDENHSAGMLKYVSIRHGGTDIGEGNEINGLTLGACGAGTEISFVEILSNKDDGVEWFGGNPRVDHVVVAYCGDDSYDYDQGFSGLNQFMVAIQDTAAADRLGEHDGGDDNETGTPFATPVFSNVTYVGTGTGQGTNNRLITFRDNAGGFYHNSVFFSQPRGIDIEDLSTDVDSWQRFEEGDLALANNVFWNVGSNDTANILSVSAYDADGNDIDPSADQIAALKQHFIDNSNKIADPGLTYDNPTLGFNYEIADFTGMDDWFEEVNYVGAFEPNQNWAAGWTVALGDVSARTAVGIFNEKISTVSADIYPNPVQNSFKLNMDVTSPVNMNIYDLSGKVVKSVYIHTSNQRIDVSDLNKGFYTFTVEAEGKLFTGKVIKK